MPGKSPLYKVIVNEFEFAFTKEQIDSVELVTKSPVEFNLIKNHRSVNAKLQETSMDAKQQTIEVNGEKFEIEIKDELDQVLDKMGFNTVVNKQVKEIKAPMPGLVLEIDVKEGQEVKDGDKILILVAMKMENSILINSDATIKKIVVSAGQPVEKGQVLVELA